MKIQSAFEFEVSTPEIAEKVIKSLKSDILNTSDFFERSNLQITSQANKIKLKIAATDLIAAKASINSCLQWIENSIKILEKYNTRKIT